jgi:hypothetical protein
MKSRKVQAVDALAEEIEKAREVGAESVGDGGGQADVGADPPRLP